MAGKPIPIVIPLKCEDSVGGLCEELKILLRSLERNAEGLGAVCIVSPCLPDWLEPSSVEWVECADVFPAGLNKDANLVNKVATALGHLGLSGCDRWTFSADDCAVLKPTDFSRLPVLHDGRTRDDFAHRSDLWSRRMANTFRYLDGLLLRQAHSWDCHIPQTFSADTVLEKLKGVPYGNRTGFCIYTLWRALENIRADGCSIDFCTRPKTLDEGMADPLDKTFVAYSDQPFIGGLRERLLSLFPHKSHYER